MVRFSFLLMLSILTLVSCGDDDDSMGGDLQATWKVESSRSGSITDIFGTETDLALIYDSGDIEIEFKSDGTYEQVGTGQYNLYTILDGDTAGVQPQTLDLTQTGTYTAMNGVLEGFSSSGQTNPAATNDFSQTYTVANDKLTIDITGTVTQGTQVSNVYGTAVYDRQ